MIQALWSVEFKLNSAILGNGVVLIEAGRILGGIDSMTFVGNLQANQEKIHAVISVEKFKVPGEDPEIDLDIFNIAVTGDSHQSHMTLYGHVLEDPSQTVSIKAVRRTEIPQHESRSKH